MTQKCAIRHFSNNTTVHPSKNSQSGSSFKAGFCTQFKKQEKSALGAYIDVRDLCGLFAVTQKCAIRHFSNNTTVHPSKNSQSGSSFKAGFCTQFKKQEKSALGAYIDVRDLCGLFAVTQKCAIRHFSNNTTIHPSKNSQSGNSFKAGFCTQFKKQEKSALGAYIDVRDLCGLFAVTQKCAKIPP